MFKHNHSHETRDNLSLYIDHRLRPADTLRVERHLGTCPACRAELESLRTTVALLQHLPAAELPRSFALPATAVPVRTRIMLPRAAFGFATACAALLLLVLFGAEAFYGGAAGERRTTTLVSAPASDARYSNTAQTSKAAGALGAEPAAPGTAGTLGTNDATLPKPTAAAASAAAPAPAANRSGTSEPDPNASPMPKAALSGGASPLPTGALETGTTALQQATSAETTPTAVPAEAQDAQQPASLATSPWRTAELAVGLIALALAVIWLVLLRKAA